MPRVVPRSTPVVSCVGLTKRFGRAVALDGLDLAVEAGEIHGFLGPNGAGKSVTLRVLLGLLRSSGGTVSLLGRDPWRDAVDLHRRVGYVPGEANLWPNLTGGEILDVLASFRGGVDRARRNRLVERFELDLTVRARNYSKGNRQKVALVAALASDVDVLLLDEPTAGLDPLMEAVFQDEIRAARDAGCSVLLSSHLLAEVEQVCDRVTIIRSGRTVQTGSLDEMRHLTRTSIDVVTERSPDAVIAASEVHDAVVEGHRARFAVDADRLGGVLTDLAQLGVVSLVSRPPTLEELFLRHYGPADGERRPSR